MNKALINKYIEFFTTKVKILYKEKTYKSKRKNWNKLRHNFYEASQTRCFLLCLKRGD